MTITKEVFGDLQEKYHKVIKLLEEDSKFDPDTEPFLSKYSARQILIGMKSNIENLLRSYTAEDPNYKKITAMMAAVHLYLGMIGIGTEERSNGQQHLENCSKIIEPYNLDSEFILIAVNLYNQFGILFFIEPEKSKTYLEKAENLYTEFKKQSVTPIDISELFEANIESYNTALALSNLEKLHTLTFYYLAQIYGALKDDFKSSIYCHITLQKQLEINDYDPVDWALNAATLSQFFMEKGGFKQARHHLAASLFILDKYKKELDENDDSSETHDALVETFKHRSADVARCWLKYGIMLLCKSKERLINHTDDDDDVKCSLSTDFLALGIDFDPQLIKYDLKSLYFKNLDVSKLEEQITDQFILVMSDAKKVFLNAQQWALKAQDYYTLENFASDFIEITLDQTQLYFNLLFFEEEPENRAKLHKRRINLFENILSNINSQYYLQYCRQIWYDLGTTYSDILHIKNDILRESSSRPTPQSLTKINKLAENGILHFTNFIKSFEEKSTKKLPTKIADDAEKPFLLAHFHKAALYGRYVTFEKQVQLKNTESSLENYKFIVDYCETNVKCKELIPMELSICNEMVTLLPLKILKLKSS